VIVDGPSSDSEVEEEEYGIQGKEISTNECAVFFGLYRPDQCWQADEGVGGVHQSTVQKMDAQPVSCKLIVNRMCVEYVK